MVIGKVGEGLIGKVSAMVSTYEEKYPIISLWTILYSFYFVSIVIKGLNNGPFSYSTKDSGSSDISIQFLCERA